jgi:hypothetical protein
VGEVNQSHSTITEATLWLRIRVHSQANTQCRNESLQMRLIPVKTTQAFCLIKTLRAHQITLSSTRVRTIGYRVRYRRVPISRRQKSVLDLQSQDQARPYHRYRHIVIRTRTTSSTTPGVG